MLALPFTGWRVGSICIPGTTCSLGVNGERDPALEYVCNFSPLQLLEPSLRISLGFHCPEQQCRQEGLRQVLTRVLCARASDATGLRDSCRGRWPHAADALATPCPQAAKKSNAVFVRFSPQASVQDPAQDLARGRETSRFVCRTAVGPDPAGLLSASPWGLLAESLA